MSKPAKSRPEKMSNGRKTTTNGPARIQKAPEMTSGIFHFGKKAGLLILPLSCDKDIGEDCGGATRQIRVKKKEVGNEVAAPEGGGTEMDEPKKTRNTDRVATIGLLEACLGEENAGDAV